MNNLKKSLFCLSPLPTSESEALVWLLVLVRASDGGSLHRVAAADFRRGWFAIGFLYPGLHPDGALDHGTTVSQEARSVPDVVPFDGRLLAPRYERSGWPVVLAPVAAEARRRYDTGELSDGAFYCSEAVIAGMCFRSPMLAKAVRRERASRT